MTLTYRHSIWVRWIRVFVSTAAFACGLTVQGVPVDMTSYDPDCGVKVNAKDDSLTARRETREGLTVLTLDVSGHGALVRSCAVGLGDSEPGVVLCDAIPVTVLTVGERDLKKRGGWTIFFDRVDRKPSESGLLNLQLTSAASL